MRTATVCLAAWAAASGVRGASAAEGFMARTSGRCTDESGGWVESRAQCEKGARALGWWDKTTGVESMSGYPRGCWRYLSGSLWFNTGTSSTTSCSTSETCMCTLTAPACTNTDGSAPNSAAPCICGNKACTGVETTGMHCYLSQNRCSQFPTCATTDGSAPNPSACACGSVDCEAENKGLFCDAATDTCSSPQDCGSDASAYISNCTNFNDRCVCVQCDAGLYSSDCSKACPAPAIAVATDTLLAVGGLWVFMAGVYYYYYSPYEEEEQLMSAAAEAGDETSEGLSEVASSNQAKRVAAKARSAARKSLLRVRALFRIGLYHLQVVASILMSIKWMPDVPPFLIGILNAVRSVLTLDVPGLMSSPACASTGSDGGAPMSPLAKWYLSLFFPLAICALFPLWYACASGSQVKIVLKEAGVQVVWVWLFATIVTACLKILDCTPPPNQSLY